MATAAPEKEAKPEDGSLKARYEDVRSRIGKAAARSGRNADEIILVAVTKTASIDQIRELIQLGHLDLGESRGPAIYRKVRGEGRWEEDSRGEHHHDRQPGPPVRTMND